VLNAPSIWYLMRASGIVSLLLLTVVVVLGILTSRRVRLAGSSRAVTTGIHRSSSLLAVAFLALHVLLSVVDPDAGVRLVALLVPFTGGSPALWLGLGALALQLVAALVVTSLLRRHFSRRVWRGIHWCAYAAWPLALVHGIGIGTDTGTSWMTAVIIACLAAAGGATAWRLLEAEPAGDASRAPRSVARARG